MARPDLLLVAKPWKGGLADYVLAAMRTLFGDARVEYIATYPRAPREWLRYRRDRSAWRRALVERINATPCQAALFINALAEYEGLDERRANVLWLTDAPSISAALAARFTRIFLSDPGYAGELPFAFAPAMHRPETGSGPRRDICFIGNRDRERDPFIAALLASPYRSTVVGNYFMRHPLYWRHPGSVRPAIPNRAMGRMYARHHLALNLHAGVVRMGTNMRTFECAGYGIPQLVQYRPGLERHFEPDAEIAVFHTLDEMLDRIGRMRADPGQAARMADRALRRAQAGHTYARRVEQALAGVLPASAFMRVDA